MIDQLAAGSARRIVVDLPQQRIAALQAGAPDAPVALLVPGYTGSKEDFAPLLDPLAGSGLHVVAIDLPGQFESPGPDDPAAYTPDRLGEVVRALAARFPAPVHLLGHSFGGLVSRAAVIAEPARFASLVLLSSGPAALGGTRRASIEQLQPVLAGAGLPGVYAAMLAAAESEPGFAAPHPDLAEFLERRFLGGSPTMLQAMGDALRHEPDRVADLAATGVPVLVTHGVDDDAWSPSTQHDMATRLGARYAVIPGSAHSPAVENSTGTVAVLVDFWRSLG
ncbi:MAG TPA: alpha/beta fold hydrolase [Jatrophihabitans sp.]|uniref:alpha/beta fold hydrolase n=1 Tax=Jatrophihabitans sp. TaxID=1932789 RepID=UPI002E0CC708|nr:alpha/beta fold hydrolase [Jatrophihabitans sp.]